MVSKKIGALWQKKKDNKTYLTGTIEVIAGQPTKIIVFKNDKKEKPIQPDWNIVLSSIPKKPKEEIVEEL